VNADNKFLSRKFLALVATLIADVAIGFGLELDPEVIVGVFAGIAAIYIAVEGWIDKAALGEGE